MTLDVVIHRSVIRGLSNSTRLELALMVLGFSRMEAHEMRLSDSYLDEYSYSLIHRAYLRLAFRYHPDRNNGRDRQFKKINSAYNTAKRLLQKRRRPSYDAMNYVTASL